MMIKYCIRGCVTIHCLIHVYYHHYYLHHHRRYISVSKEKQQSHFLKFNENNNFVKVRQTTPGLYRSAVSLNRQVLRSAIIVIFIIILSLQELQITIYMCSLINAVFLPLRSRDQDYQNRPEITHDHYFYSKSLVIKHYLFSPVLMPSSGHFLVF